MASVVNFSFVYKARDKNNLIIEVWEKLDCETVGTCEIVAIEEAVRNQFGPQAVDSPMKIARLLADEGAELRHSEIMNLFVERYAEKPYSAEFRNILNLEGLSKTLSSIRYLDNLRRKFTTDGDKEGLRLIRERVIAAKKEKLGEENSPENREIAQWLTIWLQTPEVFENWIILRRKSADFIAQFEK